MTGYTETYTGNCTNTEQLTTCSAIPFCSVCSDNVHCDQCEAYHETNLSGTECRCKIPYCLSCDTSGICTSCTSGYHLSEDNKSCVDDEGPSPVRVNVTTLVKITDECGEQ